MAEFVFRRIILVIPVVLGVSLLVFFLIHFIPGDPAVLILGESAQPADIARLRHELGLDEPLLHQLGSFLGGISRFDLGTSLHRSVPVSMILLQRFPATIELTVVSLITALLIAFPLGIISAVRARTIFDSGSMFFALLGVSMPNFWLGPLLILLFSIKLDLLPVSGRGDWTTYILPAVTLGTALAAILTRMIRSSLLEVIQLPYITTAYSKGLTPVRVILKHALRNALIPVVTIIGLQFGALLGGSIITETIFSWPGIGRELIEAIQGRDYPVVQGCVLLISLAYVLVNLATDMLYGFLDPRIQLAVRLDHSRRAEASFFSRIFKHRKFILTASGILLAAAWLSGTPGIRIKVSQAAGLIWSAVQVLPAVTESHIDMILQMGIVLLIPIAMLIWHRSDPRSWRRFARTQTAWAGLGIFCVFLIVGLFGPRMAPYDPLDQNLERRLESPSAEHWMGTDEIGRDVLSRVLDGTRISVKVGLIVTLVSAFAGTLIGMVSGLAGGWVDEMVMRVVDILLAFPGILLAIALVAVLGPDINNVILALCLMGWVGFARLARAQVLKAREEEYVESARALGSSASRLITRHLLPNIIAPIVVQATLGMAGVIVAEAGLSFLGLGVQPPTPSWGGILNSGVDFFMEGPHMTVFPGLAIMVVVMGLNFFGDGLRDALDPRAQQS